MHVNTERSICVNHVACKLAQVADDDQRVGQRDAMHNTFTLHNNNVT